MGELGSIGDVGRPGDLVLVAEHENAVPARDDVGLDGIGTEGERELVARPAVLRPVARSPPVTDDEGSRTRG
jgi:hypothetical protein